MTKNKKHRTDIHQVGFWYRTFRPVVDLATRMCYSRIQVHGLENLPQDGSFIISPNHSDALMDAVTVLQTRKEPTVFGARADLFENPVLAKLMHFIKIVPMVRKRDGIRKVIRNLDIIEDITEVLDEGVPFCMYPEGTHRPKHSLLPVGKGIFRVAVSAARSLDKTVYVVPAGIEYSDYYRLNGSCLVNFGKPINVTAFLNEHPDMLDAELYRNLTAELQLRMSELFSYIPDDENFDAVWAYTKIMASDKRRGSVYDRMMASRAIINSEKDPEKLEMALDFDRKRHAAGLSIKAFNGHCVSKFVFKTLGLLLFLPVVMVCGILAFPQLIAATLVNRLCIADRAFYNSIRYLMALFVTPLTTIGWLIALACISSIPFWPVFPFILVASLLAPFIFYKVIEWYRVWFSELRLFKYPELKELFNLIKK